MRSPMRKAWLWAKWLVLLSSLTGNLHATDVSVAVAANFLAPMRLIAQAFEQETGHKVLAAYGATGSLYAQIRNGAPHQLLLAADDTTPKKLEDEGFGVPGYRFTYATGRLALWSRQPGLVDGQGEVLRSGKFRRLAMANPKLAPYGAAALETLTRLGLLEQVRPKLVQGDNIAQTHQFVDTGNAELGFVALSQVLTQGQLATGSAWVVPASMHSPLRQDAILLTLGRDQPAALALLRYLKSEKALTIMRAFGYLV